MTGPPVDEAAIDHILAERVVYKKKRLFEDADRLRDVLALEYGVQIWDKDRVWTTGGTAPKGRQAAQQFSAGAGSESLDDEALMDVARKVRARGDAQRRKDYEAADAIREDLRARSRASRRKRRFFWGDDLPRRDVDPPRGTRRRATTSK